MKKVLSLLTEPINDPGEAMTVVVGQHHIAPLVAVLPALDLFLRQGLINLGLKLNRHGVIFHGDQMQGDLILGIEGREQDAGLLTLETMRQAREVNTMQRDPAIAVLRTRPFVLCAVLPIGFIEPLDLQANTEIPRLLGGGGG